MARRAKRASAQPADGVTPAATDETTSLLGAGVGPADSPGPSALPAPTVTTASTGDAGIMVTNAPEIGDDPVLLPFVIVEPPVPAALAPGCRHAVMRAGWDRKGPGKRPVRRCDDCGYTEPRGEDGRPTVPWT